MRSNKFSHPVYLFTFLVCILSLTGCVTLKDPETSQEQSSEILATLEGGHTVGQSFISRRAKLNGIWLWLNLAEGRESGDGKLIVQLYHTPGETLPLAAVTLPLRSLPRSNPIHVDLPVQSGPPGQAYYLSLLATSGKTGVFGRGEDSYAYGSAYLDGRPLEGDIAFRTSYDYDWAAVWGDLRTGMGWIWLAFPLAIVLLLPGWFLLSLLTERDEKAPPDHSENMGIVVGISMAAIPLLMAWTTLVKLPWSRAALLFGAGLIWAALLWRLTRHRVLIKPGWTDLGLLVVFTATLAVRLMMVRDLAAPAWVDSVHHSLLTRLILEQGGYPDSYMPYLDIDGARYHPGFHSLLASFQWLSGLESLQAMLLFGQVLNALSVLAVYLFTKTLTENRLASLIAALITGFFTPMPAYYASWGRYTELAGLLILPVAFSLVRSVGSLRVDGKLQWKKLLLAAIACAGLFITHYRVIAFLGGLLIANFLGRIFDETLISLKTIRAIHWLREIAFKYRSEIISIAAITVASFLLLVPWLPSALTSLILPKALTWSGGSQPLFDGFAWSFLTTAFGKYSLYLAGLGLVWSLLKRPSLIITLLLWAIAMFAMANLGVIGILRGLINNVSVEISLFMPISALCGYFASQIIQLGSRWVPKRFSVTAASGGVIATLIVTWVAALQLLPTLNPITFLFRQADRPALAWIRENVPEEATILINPFAWGYGLYAGNDGGFWITPLAGNRTLPPPVLYGMDNNLQRIQQINHLSQQVIEQSRDVDALYSLLQEHGIGYIYIGYRGGVLSPRAFQSSTHYQVLYHRDGTWLFQVK